MGGQEKISTSVWREMEDRQTDMRSKRHHGNERAPFLNKSHFDVKLSWAEDKALRSPGTIRTHQMRLDVSAVRGSVVTWNPPPPPTHPPPHILPELKAAKGHLAAVVCAPPSAGGGRRKEVRGQR